MNYDGPIVQYIKETAGHGMQEKKQKALHFFFLREKDSALKIRAVITLCLHSGNFGYMFGYEKNKNKSYCGFLEFYEQTRHSCCL